MLRKVLVIIIISFGENNVYIYRYESILGVGRENMVYLTFLIYY